MKIYTRTGDSGTTGLFGAGRVPKTHSRIEAYGTVDETSSFIGLARAHLRGEAGADDADPLLHRIQEELLTLGADLATPEDARVDVRRVSSDEILRLEQAIDRFEADLPQLKNFILPAGSAAGAALHVARTVCRRAERVTIEAAREEALNQQVAIYLNRLSDLLFVLARWVSHRSGLDESVWTSR